MATQNTYTGQIAGKLGDYRSRGHKEAGKHRPPTTATAPDQHESELKSIGDGWLTKVQQQFDKVITEASRSSTEARQKFIELQATFDQLLRDDTATSTVDAELAGERTALVNATEARVRAEVELRYFKAANDIHEEAKYPESKINHIGWLLAIGLFEAIVNGFFYENAQGLLGGVMVAAGIAALNILAGFGFGIGFRNINLAAIEKKLFGWGCLVAFTLLAIFCNSLFAAFRSEYQLISDPSDYAEVTQAFQRALPNALAIFKLEIRFQDHWSFLLFGLGMVASAIAFYKGYTFDDKYPGYGVKDRRYRAALETEQALHERLRQRVKELLLARKASVQAAMHEPSTQVGMLARRIADVAHAKTSLESQAAAIDRDHGMVAEAYRHANLAVRGTEAPAYFGVKPALSIQVDSSGAERLTTDLAEVQSELKQLGEDKRTELNDKLKELQENTTDILGKTFGAFVLEIQREAEEKIDRARHAMPKAQVV